MTKRLKHHRLFMGLLLVFCLLYVVPVFADTNPPPAAPLKLAADPSQCESNVTNCAAQDTSGASSSTSNTSGLPPTCTPANCIFLEEPIGGKQGWDLYTVTCSEGRCTYNLWQGQYSLAPNTRGPIQAVLSADVSKPENGPFTLLYNYLGLIYNYMSGIIVGMVVLFSIIGGIQMITAGGDEHKFEEGKNHIIQAIMGMILWFVASLVLYTINPTFFAF